MEGKYAGGVILREQVEKSLSEGQEFIVGNPPTWAEYHGGFTKVFSGVCPSANTAADKQAAAQLIEFLLNSDEGAKLDEQPARHPAEQKKVTCSARRRACSTRRSPRRTREGARLVLQQADPKFESSASKNSDGVYYDAMDGLSYKDYSIEEAARCYEGITEVLAK